MRDIEPGAPTGARFRRRWILWSALAIAAHRDDVELTCAGTLLKAVDAGYRTGILAPSF